MIGRVAALIYGLASYLVFFVSVVYAMGFIGNYLVPKSIDVGSESELAQSILIDVALLGVFAVQHSVMARVRPSSAGGRGSSRRPASAAPMC